MSARTPASIAAALERADALARTLGDAGLAAAFGRMAARRRRELVRHIARAGEPVRHGGRIYSIALGDGLRAALAVDAEGEGDADGN